MAVNYFMCCPTCQSYALILRFGDDGPVPPSGVKVHNFFIAHCTHVGFEAAVREQEGLWLEAFDYDWDYFDTYGEGDFAKLRER